MKTAAWSLAFAAGVLATSPGDYVNYGLGDKSSAPAGYGSSSEAAPESSAPAGYGSSASAVYSSSAAPSSASGYETGCTTTYESTCVETSTLIYRSTTDYSKYTITHTLTTSMDGECPSSIPVYPSSSVAGPTGYPSESAPVYPSESEAAPSGGYPAETGPAVVTVTKTNTKTVCPCEVTPVENGPTRTPGEVYVTQFTTEYVTTCPGKEPQIATFTYGDWTSIYTSYSLTTTTEVITKTVTQPEYPHSTADNGGGYPASSAEGYSSSGSGSYGSSAPGGYGSSSGSGTSPSSAPGGYGSSSGAGSYPSSASGGWGSSSGSGTSPSSAPGGYGSSSGSGTYPSSAPGGYGSSSSGVVYPSGSSSAGPESSSGVVYPSGSSASGYPSSSLPPYPSGSDSSAWPSGTGYSSSSWAPSGTGYSSSSYSIHPTGSSSSSAAPTGTPGCVPCEGQPGNDPEKWCGYTINDNWYQVTPKTCKTREFFYTITQEEISPDGVPRLAMVADKQMPGPTIEANWGDEIIVHVTNGMPLGNLNGSSIHFHGIRMNGTNEMDGVPSITQCPIAPGHSMTYKWTATSYGTSWWHSHYALQAYEGVYGPLIIHGPASAEYDEEQFIALQDWNHIPYSTLYHPAEVVSNGQTGPLTLDTGLINGMNVWEGAGKRWSMTVESGKSYRLRILNGAIQSLFAFYVDGHELEVIAMDFVPITPYTTNMIHIANGQRYDVILKANQPSGNYWMRSDNQQPCGPLRNSDDIKAILHYADASVEDPTTTAQGYAPACVDEPYDKLVPIVPWDAGAADDTIDKTAAIGPYQTTNLFKWTLSGTTFYSEWEHPTLKQIYEDGTIPDTSGNLAIEIPELKEWVYVIIETPIPLPHPIHLHGHDFLVLAQGTGPYSSAVALNLANPPRRDTAIMPAAPGQAPGGYLVIAFQTSNPGVWLLHCHIGWVS
jgi:FtsP/CotA-like multicopper oxidase with cupredoxin domain